MLGWVAHAFRKRIQCSIVQYHSNFSYTRTSNYLRPIRFDSLVTLCVEPLLNEHEIPNIHTWIRLLGTLQITLFQFYSLTHHLITSLIHTLSCTQYPILVSERWADNMRSLLNYCFRGGGAGGGAAAATVENVNEVCMPGRWYNAALTAQRSAFEYAEANGCLISEGRLYCGGGSGDFLNYITAKAFPSDSARATRYAVRKGELDSIAPGCHRPLGRVLVLIASWGSGIGLFSPCLPALVDYFEVIYCIDMAGMGLSSRWVPSTSVNEYWIEQGKMFTAAFRHLGVLDSRFKLARTRVLGVHSMGNQFVLRWFMNGGVQAELPFHMVTLISPVGNLDNQFRHAETGNFTRVEQRLLNFGRWCSGRHSSAPLRLFRWLPKSIAFRLIDEFLSQVLTENGLSQEIVNYLMQIMRAPCYSNHFVYSVYNNDNLFLEQGIEQLMNCLKIPVVIMYGLNDLNHTGGAFRKSFVEQMETSVGVYRVCNARHLPFYDNVPEFTAQFMKAFCKAMEWNRDQKEMCVRSLI